MSELANGHLLQVIDLKTYFFVKRGILKAVDGVNIYLDKGEVLGIVGESASGKSITGLSLMRLIEPPGQIVGGQIFLNGRDLLKLKDADMRNIRGREITMIQQNPDTSLNPVFRINDQIAEAIMTHRKLSNAELNERVIELLRLVRIPSPEVRAMDYPHQMSGGMRQRIAGAIALACDAKLLIADEPTTNLDVTTQAQYIRLLEQIQSETGLGIIFITHDFGIVSTLCNRVVVMYAGRIIESGPTKDLMERPAHPYTRALLDSVPKPGVKLTRLHSIQGGPPNPLKLPSGCRFAPRCEKVTNECLEIYPEEVKIDNNRTASCHHVR
jgi:oligopeptide/dipeptide ABC transporter ATP-binding protein